MFEQILVVCTGNLCRSPFAERLLQTKIPTKTIVSAGTNVESCHLEVATVPEHARRVAYEFGCDLTDHKPQQLTSELLDSSDLVLVMSHEHIDIVARVTQNARSKTLLLGQWVGIGDIEDPLQGDVDKYRQCYSVLALAIESWRKKLT